MDFLCVQFDFTIYLYFLEKTEREIAALEGIYHNAVHKRKLRILSKLKKLFEEI